jgi:hypothetical protein
LEPDDDVRGGAAADGDDVTATAATRSRVGACFDLGS